MINQNHLFTMIYYLVICVESTFLILLIIAHYKNEIKKNAFKTLNPAQKASIQANIKFERRLLKEDVKTIIEHGLSFGEETPSSLISTIKEEADIAAKDAEEFYQTILKILNGQTAGLFRVYKGTVLDEHYTKMLAEEIRKGVASFIDKIEFETETNLEEGGTS